MNHAGAKNPKTRDGSECSWLDAYLDGEMEGQDAVAFELHLAQCARCAEAVDQQRWINDLLRSSELAEVESAPTGAIASTKAALKQRRRRRVAVAVCIAAAIAALAAWPRFPLPRRDGSNRARSPVAIERRAVVRNESPMTHQPAATFVSTGDAIAVPVASTSSEVTIVQVYPTLDHQRRLQLTAVVSSLSPEPNGG